MGREKKWLDRTVWQYNGMGWTLKDLADNTTAVEGLKTSNYRHIGWEVGIFRIQVSDIYS